jgi:FkbM family methyltransferase
MKIIKEQSTHGERFLFGAGGAASWVLQGFVRAGIRIDGFIDDAADQIQTVGNLPVHAPNSVHIPIGQRKKSTVIFAVMNPAVNESAARDRLLGLGWGEVLSFGEFGRNTYRSSGKLCSMLDASDICNHKRELAATRTLLNDDHSRQVFDAFVAFVTQLDDSGFPEITPDPYFPADLPRWPKHLRMIDCGAFDGDSVRAAIKHGYNIEASISFEPDPANFAKLAQNNHAISGAMAWPCGVLDRTDMLQFSAQSDTGSSISNDGGISIQCVKLDDVIPHFAPNMIKLDIEGSEEAALRGAETIIRSSRTGLAVSVYHLPTDIWRIPLYLSSVIGPKCQFYLRRHSRTIADTVLYVYPER